jgi:hypothetical protein
MCLLCIGSPLAFFPQNPPPSQVDNSGSYGSIRGSVLAENSKPIEGATVYVLPASDMRHEIRTQTDHEGNFVISNLPLGEAYISAYDEDLGYPYNFFSFFLIPGQQPQKIVISAKTESSEFIIKLGAKAARLFLEIVDEAGVPITEPAQLIFNRPDLPGDYKRGAGASVSLLVPPVPFRLSVQVKGFRKWTYQNKSGGDMLHPHSEEIVKLTVHLVKE